MKCTECGEEAEYYEVCFECCEHSDIERDDRTCLICGADMTEHLVAEAEFYSDLKEDR